jgi:hypothetical protein
VSKCLKSLSLYFLIIRYGADIIYGTWVKKERYQMEPPMNPRTGKLVETPVYRGRYVKGSFNWADFSEEERESFTMAKLMNELSDEDRAKWSMAV